MTRARKGASASASRTHDYSMLEVAAAGMWVRPDRSRESAASSCRLFQMDDCFFSS